VDPELGRHAPIVVAPAAPCWRESDRALTRVAAARQHVTRPFNRQ
jgi:hypothetical protein